MGRFLTLSILRMLHSLSDVLLHLSPQSYSQSLNATTDTQHRNLSIISQANQEELSKITLPIDMMELRRRLLTHPERVVVAATSKNQSVQMLERIDDNICISNRRNDNRSSARSYHLFIISVTKRSIYALVVGSNTNYRLMRSLGKNRIYTLQV